MLFAAGQTTLKAPLGHEPEGGPMTDFAAFIAEIVTLNGGCLREKTRLQKTAYFLEANNLGYGFDFGYHYYGLYSEDVTIAVDDAWVRNLIDVHPVALSAMHALTNSSAVSGHEWKPICRNISLCCSESM